MIDLAHVAPARCIVANHEVALTSECGAAEGEYSETGRLLKCGVRPSASEHWPWGESALFSILNVSVGSGAPVEAAQPPGEDWRDEASWAKDDFNAVMICNTEKNRFLF